MSSKTRKKIFPILEKKLENIGSMIINEVKTRNNIRKFMGSNIKKRVKFNGIKSEMKKNKKYKYTPKKR
uniref:Uncharacterized protein n=1 Tax=viral metagenome TaxID=1070528 RepID=A0A6C0H5J6_9ZZZZ